MRGRRGLLQAMPLHGALALVLAGCGPTSGPTANVVDLPAPAPVSVGAAQSAAQYRISLQDTLEINVYQVPDLSRTVEVDGTGRISLPLIGTVDAAGKTARELEAHIAGRLGARYLKSPQVSVYVKDAIGQRVTVDGAVKKPGVIQAKGETTLLRILAEAQGFTETADLTGVMVFRVTSQGRMGARFDANTIRSGQAPDPRIYGGDTIVVDESGGKATWKQFREALPVAGLFRIF